jgi:hypothetical protein
MTSCPSRQASSSYENHSPPVQRAPGRPECKRLTCWEASIHIPCLIARTPTILPFLASDIILMPQNVSTASRVRARVGKPVHSMPGIDVNPSKPGLTPLFCLMSLEFFLHLFELSTAAYEATDVNEAVLSTWGWCIIAKRAEVGSVWILGH